jgi:hypothetical protein
MRKSRSRRSAWVLGILALLVVIPVAVACVIPRDLAGQIKLSGDEIAIGTVVAVHETWLDETSGGTFPWTVVDFDVKESFVTGKTGLVQIATRGGLQEGSPSTSITPSPEDLKPGRKLLVFLNGRNFESAQLGASAPFVIASFAEVYRIEEIDTRTGPREILVGQGAGMAFPANVEVDQARSEIKALTGAKGGEKR